MIDLPPRPQGDSWVRWANRLGVYLAQARDRLRYKRGDDKATDNGILLWDNDSSEPVVSLDGEYVPLILKDGHGIAYSNTDITAAAINTAYGISWDGISSATGVSVDGTHGTRLNFTQGGTFMFSFSVQVTSNSSSLKTLWFWPRVNGSDVAGSTIKVSISDNGGTVVMSRSALFDISAGDYLEAYWATDDTDVTLEAAPAETFAPATPSVILGVTRIHQ